MTPIKTYQVTYQFGGNAAELQNVLTDLEKKATSVSKIFQALPQNLQVKTGKNSAVDSVIEAYNKLAQGQSKVLESQAGLVSNWKKQLQEMKVATKTAVNSINDILGSVSIPAGAFKGLETLANLKAGGSAKSKGAQKMLPAALGNYGSIKDFEDDFERTRKQAVKAIRDIRTLTPLFDKHNAASKQLEEIEKKGDKADKQWRPRGATAEERNALGRQRASLLASKLAASKALIAASDAAGGGLATTKAFDALKKSYEEKLKPAYKDLKKQSKQILAARQHDKSASSANEDPFNININVDTAAAKTALEKLAADFKTLSKEFIIKPTIQIDANAATAKLKEAKAEMLVKPIIDQEALAAVQGSLKEVAVPIKPTEQSVRNKAAKEAVADAKLNLSDQAKQLQQYATKHPVKIKTVYEAKGLTAKLNQTIKSLQTTAKGKSITITTNFSADGIVAALDAALIKAQKLAQSKALTVKTNLLSESNGAAVNTSIDKLQKNVNSKPISIKTRLTGGGENGEALSLSIGKLQKLANERAILLRTKLAGTGEVGEALSPALGRLQELANTKPIIIKTQLDTALTSEQLNSLLATTAKTAATAKSNSVAAGGSSDKEAKESKAPKNPWAMSKSDYNSYMREEEKMRQQLIASARANGSGRNGTIANIRRNAYPWTGNTSFGARTPVALDMAKGMGMMFAVSGLMSTVTESFHQVTEYDNLMKTVRAILQTTDKGPNFNGRFENMENTVRDVGRKTKFTAPEVAGAARFMAMAGLNIENINAATEPIANLALIGDTELSETADKMTNIMTSFGLLKGLSAGQQKKNMIHTSDVLTNTFTRSNTDMLQLAEAMQYAGPMSHLFGTSLEDAAAMVGVMGNAGIQASMAGTSLRMMYQNIVKPNAKQSKEWDRLGIARTDKNGNIRPIFEILKDLRAKLTGTKDLNAKIDPDTLKSLGTGVLSLFRTTAGSGVAALLENLGEAEAIANTNRSANGVAAKIADEKKNTIAGLWAQVTSTFTDQNLTVATDFQNTIKQILTDLRDWLSSTEAAETLRSVYDLVNSILNVFKEVAKLWIGMYRIWPGFFKTLIAVQFAISQVGALMSPFIGLLSVIGSVKNTVMGLAGAFGTLNTAAGISSFGAGGVGNLGRAAAGGAAASSVASKAANVASSAKAFGLGSGFIGYMGASAAVLAPNKAAHPNYLGEYTRRKEFYKARAWKNGQIVDLHAFFQSQRYDAAIKTAAVMSARRAEAHRMYLERRADPKKFVETHKKADGSSYGIGAYHTNMQRRANARQANRILSNATLLRATQMGKINAAQSAGLAFRNGMAAANAVSFVPLLTNVKNSLLSVVNAVSRGLGMLISPIGLVATALVGMAYLWSHFYNKQKELIKKDEELAKRGESGRNITKQAIMGNLGVVGSLNPSQTLTAPRHSVSRARTGRTILGSRFDPLLRNSREYRGAFDAAALNSPDYYDTYMKRFADTAGALYGKRGVKMNGWQILTSEAHYQRKHNKNGAAPMIGSLEGNKALRRDALNRLTAFNLGSASSEFASKKRIVQRWINSYDQLPESKKTPAAQQKLYHNISAMASSLREEAAERPTVIGRNISNMRATQVAQSREAYEGMAQQIEAMKDYVNGFNTSLQQLAGMMTFQAQNIHGQIVNFNLPFNKGALDWKALEMQFKMLGVKFQSNLNGHWSMMLQVFNTIQNNAELAQKYAGMSAGQLAALFDPIKGGYKFNPQEWKGWVSDWYNDNNWEGKKKYKNAQDFFNRGGWRTDTSLNAIRNHAFDKMTGGAKIKGNSNGVGGSSSSLNSGTTAGGGAHNATDQSKYDSKYKNNRSRPTQIIFKIGNLCNFNNTKVNNPADLSAVEGVGKQLSIGLQELFAQAVSEYAIIGESQG